MPEGEGYKPSEAEIADAEAHMTGEERRISNSRQEQEVERKLGETYLSTEYAIKERTKENFSPYYDSKKLMDEISDGLVPTPEVDQANIKEKLIGAMQRAKVAIERDASSEISEIEHQGTPRGFTVNLTRDQVKEQIAEVIRQKDADLGEIGGALDKIETDDLGGALKLLRGLVIFEDYDKAMKVVRDYEFQNDFLNRPDSPRGAASMKAKQQFAEDIAIVDFFEKSANQQG